MTKVIEISDETYEKLKIQLGVDEVKELSCLKDMVGEKFFFRTVTYHIVGKVEKQIGDFVKLSDASWVADSGRFMNAIKEGKLNEVEPVGIAYLNIQTVTDFFPWRHALPKDQK